MKFCKFLIIFLTCFFLLDVGFSVCVFGFGSCSKNIEHKTIYLDEKIYGDQYAQKNSLLTPYGIDFYRINRSFEIDERGFKNDEKYEDFFVYPYKLSFGENYLASESAYNLWDGNFNFIPISMEVLNSDASPRCVFGGDYIGDAYYVLESRKGIRSWKTGGGLFNKKKRYIEPRYQPYFKKIGLLFHCTTTKEFLQKIKVPFSWENSDILVYCSDGSKTNFNKINIGVKLNQLKSYKTCFVKNLDTEEYILSILETGNEKFSKANNQTFFSNESSEIEDYFEELFQKENLELDINYQSVVTPNSVSSINQNNYLPSCNPKSLPQGVNNLDGDSCIIEDEEDLRAHPTKAEFVKNNYVNLKNLYTVSGTINKTQFDDNSYHFNYSSKNRILTITNFNNSLNQSLVGSEAIFTLPTDFKTSRIFLAKKKDTKKTYGYERALSQTLTSLNHTGITNNVRPLYVVESSVVNLGSFCNHNIYLKEFIQAGSIKCVGNKITINSQGIDGDNYGRKVGAEQKINMRSFNLFKNIVLLG